LEACLSVRFEEMAGELFVRPPFAGEERVLTLAPAAWIEVIVQDELGLPVFGSETGAGSLIDRTQRFADWKFTAADGRVRLGPLNAGPHVLVARSPFAMPEVAQQIDLAAGRTATVMVVLEHGNRRLAAAGRIVEPEDGAVGERPDHLMSRVDEGLWRWIDVRADGSFEVWSPPGREVELRAAAFVDQTACEPAERRVAFGTTGLVFHALPKTTSDPWHIEVRDRESGAPIHDSGLWITRYRDDRELSYGERLPTGVYVTELPRRREVWVVATAAGYRECAKRLPAVGEGPVGPLQLNLELDRGVTGHVRLHSDDADERGIPGVRLRFGSTVVAITDAGGRADFDLDYVPEAITFEAEGYESEDEWDPRYGSSSAERQSFYLWPRKPDDGAGATVTDR
jgi:hypothetical protein